MTRQPGGKSSELRQPKMEKPKARSKAKASGKERKESMEKVEEAVEEEGAQAAPEDLTVAADGSDNKTVVVEHWLVSLFSLLKYYSTVGRKKYYSIK